MISTHNQFSFWEDDGTIEPVLLMFEEIKTEKNKVIKGMNKVKVTKQMKKVKTICCGLKVFETKNAEIETMLEDRIINVSDRFNEPEIGQIVQEESKSVIIKSRKKKCRSCGYRKTCHLQQKCRAQDKNCYACLGQSHFPKSQNCLSKRKKKKNGTKPSNGCLTLRQFLKTSGIKLNAYHSSNDISKTCNFVENKKVNNTDEDEVIKLVEEKVSSLERQAQLKSKFQNCPYYSKFFVASYILINMEHIHETQANKMANYLDREACDESQSNELHEIIEQFLDIGNESTHCLENYVENGEVIETPKDLSEQLRKHKENIKIFVKKLEKDNELTMDDEDAEILEFM